jgi:hypothetical protein
MKFADPDDIIYFPNGIDQSQYHPELVCIEGRTKLKYVGHIEVANIYGFSQNDGDNTKTSAHMFKTFDEKGLITLISVYYNKSINLTKFIINNFPQHFIEE